MNRKIISGQISTSLYERLLLSEGKTNKETVLALAFLLELGRGFMFVGTQQRITLNNTHYYAAEVNDEHDNPPIGILYSK